MMWLSDVTVMLRTGLERNSPNWLPTVPGPETVQAGLKPAADAPD